MTPVDFYCVPNKEALHQKVVIRGELCEYEVLSYYYDEDVKAMVLDVEERKE